MRSTSGGATRCGRGARPTPAARRTRARGRPRVQARREAGVELGVVHEERGARPRRRGRAGRRARQARSTRPARTRRLADAERRRRRAGRRRARRPRPPRAGPPSPKRVDARERADDRGRGAVSRRLARDHEQARSRWLPRRSLARSARSDGLAVACDAERADARHAATGRRAVTTSARRRPSAQWPGRTTCSSTLASLRLRAAPGERRASRSRRARATARRACGRARSSVARSSGSGRRRLPSGARERRRRRPRAVGRVAGDAAHARELCAAVRACSRAMASSASAEATRCGGTSRRSASRSRSSADDAQRRRARARRGARRP